MYSPNFMSGNAPRPAESTRPQKKSPILGMRFAFYFGCLPLSLQMLVGGPTDDYESLSKNQIQMTMQPIINSNLPEFKVHAYAKSKGFHEVSNEDLKGRWSVLFFYPGDFTFVCPTELADLADNYAEFQQIGVDIYSVSTDSHFVHKAWQDASEAVKKVQYTMLADMRFELARAFGVMIEEAGQAYRGTFLIDPDGKVRVAEIHDNGIGRDAQELLRKVRAAQFIYEHPGEVCPAKWRQGDATLKPSIDLVGKI